MSVDGHQVVELASPADARQEMNTGLALLLVLAVAVPLFFLNLGGRDFWAPDEPRFAQIGREMVSSGDWIIPRMNGQDVALLPPLTYWLVALPSVVRGEVTEFTARVLIAVTGLVGVLATFFLGKKMYTCRVGVLSAVILATSFKYLWQARWLQADMPLTAFVSLALLFFYCGLRTERRKAVFYHLFCACMALAFLAKGPLGIVLPGLVILPYLTLTRNWHRVREMYIPTGILLALAIVLPWYVASGIWGGKEFLREVVIKHNFGMFFQTWSHKQPFYFYIPHAFWLMMPWALFLFPALWHLIVQKQDRDQKVFLLSWLVAQFLFFSASQAKQEKYLLPLFPAAALVIGKAWTDWIAGILVGATRKTMTAIAVLTTGFMALAGLLIPVIPLVLTRMGRYPDQFAGLVPYALPLAPLLALAAVPMIFGLRGQPGRLFVSLAILVTMVHLYCGGVFLDRIDALKSAKEFCKRVRNTAAPDAPIGIYGIGFRQIGAYLFYLDTPLDKPLKTFEDEQERFVPEQVEEFLRSQDTVYCMVKDSYLQHIQERSNVKVRVHFSGQIGSNKMCLISNQTPSQEGDAKP